MHYFPTCQQSFFFLSAIIEGKTIEEKKVWQKNTARSTEQTAVNHSLGVILATPSASYVSNMA